MAVAVQQPQQRRDPLATLLTGLQIAQGVYGIKSDMDRAEALKADQDAKDAERQRLSSNILNKREQIELSKTHAPVAPNTPGATEIVDADTGQTAYLLPRKENEQKAEYAPFNELTPGGNALVLNKYTGEVIEGPKVKVKADPIAEAAKEPKPNQFQAATFGRRLEAAEAVFSDLVDKGYDRTSYESSAMSLLPEAAKPGELKQQEQAERNFINALLRRESGSAISDAEFANAEKQYFPRAGDNEETLAQKTQNRALSFEGLRQEAGPAWQRVNTPSLNPPNMTAGKKPESKGEAKAKEQKPDVTQNGHTYKWNAKKGKYE